MPTRLIREGILTSPKVNGMTPLAQWFFHRLLNVVDDFGRFMAPAAVLRAECFPLCLASAPERSVRRWRDECEKAGLIVVYKAPGGEYLEVQNFKQKIRALKSKFPNPPSKCLASVGQDAKQMLNLVVVVDEDVGAVVGATPPTPSTTPRLPKGIELPANLATVGFITKWNEWSDHRRQIHKTLTPLTTQRQLNNLSRAGPDIAMAMINQSIENGWTGLFEVKDGIHGRTTQAGSGKQPRQGRRFGGKTAGSAEDDPAALSAFDDPPTASS